MSLFSTTQLNATGHDPTLAHKLVTDTLIKSGSRLNQSGIYSKNQGGGGGREGGGGRGEA